MVARAMVAIPIEVDMTAKKKNTKKKTTRAKPQAPLRKASQAKPKQAEIYTQGEDGRIPELADAVQAFVEASDARSDAAKERERSAATVLRLLHEHKRTSYRAGSVTVTLRSGAERIGLKRDKTSDSVIEFDVGGED